MRHFLLPPVHHLPERLSFATKHRRRCSFVVLSCKTELHCAGRHSPHRPVLLAAPGRRPSSPYFNASSVGVQVSCGDRRPSLSGLHIGSATQSPSCSSTPSAPHPRCSSVTPRCSHGLFPQHRAPPPPRPADQELDASWYAGARASPSSRAIVYSEITPTSSSVGRAVPDLCHRTIDCHSRAVLVRAPSFLSFSALMLHSAALGHGDGQCSVKKCPVNKRTSCLRCLYMSILHL
jgi:hypothetical protein